MKFWALFIVVLIVSLCACATPKTANNVLKDSIASYPEYTGQYAGFSLIIDERFDDFDPTIWKKGDGAVGGEADCRFQDQGIQVVNGMLELIVSQETIKPSWSVDHQQQKNGYDFSCGELRTHANKKIKFGRIETRMRAPNRATASGYISSLFTYSNDFDRHAPNSGVQEWEEIDVELEGGRPDKFQANLIYGRNTWEWWRTRDYGAWEDKIVVGPVDEWRVYAIEWVPDAIRWYVDGKLVKELKQSDIDCQPQCKPPQRHPTPIPDNPTNIFMNFWIPKDAIQNEFGGNKKHNVYPLKTQYDWIRYYQLDSHPVGWE
ncbi:glycoside hydrolase family 16 protein [Aliiglaciecola litoralis]|uniref:Beta-glucanase n=1 Tax=Aliiglaciecola litoralis TaxID=582857 RepID=A0ABN1LL34_9ALTE